MKNKILAISIIFILIIFINISFASTTSELPSMFELCIEDLSSKSINYYDYIILTSPIDESGVKVVYFYFFINDTYQCYISSNIIKCNHVNIYAFYNYTSSDYIIEESKNLDTILSYTNLNAVSVSYSSFDLKNEDGSLFFQQTPVPQDLTLAVVLEMIQVQEMWKTLMKNVVISLLVFVVSYLALRKAWSFLRTQLKGS